MEKVLIEIIGSQNIDNQFDKTEFKTVGTFEELEEKYVIKYKEEQDAGEEPINVSVVVLKDESSVEMTREGAVVSRLVIERSQRNLCHYGTAYGEILMGISGHSIEHEFDENGGKFTFGYDIDINGALASKNRVKLSYKKKKQPKQQEYKDVKIS